LQSSLLAGKIGEVLIATMSGLVVAVPAFIFFYVLRAQSQRAILHAESQVYRLLDEIPYDQLSGVRIGEEFGSDAGAKSRSIRSNVSQKSRATSPPTVPPATRHHGGHVALPELRHGARLGRRVIFNC